MSNGPARRELIERVNQLVAAGDPAGAAVALNEAIEQGGAGAPLHLRLARLQHRAGDHSSTLRTLDRAAEAFPNESELAVERLRRLA